MKQTDFLSWQSIGQKFIAVTWTASPRSTSVTGHVAGTPPETPCCIWTLACLLRWGGLSCWEFLKCDPAEGRLNSRTLTISDGDASRAAALFAAFPRAVEIAQPFSTRTDLRRDGSFHTLSRIDRSVYQPTDGRDTYLSLSFSHDAYHW